jgi:primosomal replication protein N
MLLVAMWLSWCWGAGRGQLATLCQAKHGSSTPAGVTAVLQSHQSVHNHAQQGKRSFISMAVDLHAAWMPLKVSIPSGAKTHTVCYVLVLLQV